MKRMKVTPYSCIFDAYEWGKFVRICYNKLIKSHSQVQAHYFVNVSMEMIVRSNVTCVTGGYFLPLIIIVAKLSG
jgi:hypothetical protein